MSAADHRARFQAFARQFGVPEAKARQLLVDAGALPSLSAKVGAIDYAGVAATLRLEPAQPVSARAQQIYPGMEP